MAGGCSSGKQVEVSISPHELRERLRFADERLLAECELQRYRAPGPGGQKRNKTDSAVRLHHRPSGLAATATESRSQHDNKLRALRRLRTQIAVSTRIPPAPSVEWPAGIQATGSTLKVRPSNPAIHALIALLLDDLQASGGLLSEVAERWGVSSSSLVRLLASVPVAWAEVNKLRAAFNRKPLRP